MKRTIALLLSALLALSASSALGSEVMTLDEKLALQLQNGSGLIVAADFSASSDLDLSVLDEQMNTLLKALLPGSRLDIKRVQGAGSGNRGKEDMTLTLSRAGAPLADLRHTSDGVLESFTSSLFGGKSYASARGDGLLLDLLMDRGTAWPGLERAIYAVYGADLEWRKQADAQLKAVSDKLSLWLQGYTRVSTERDAQNQLITVNTITIPMADLKARMKTLLADLYANRTLSGLLREVMTSAESAAYLEPSMLQGFSAAIDRLPVSGNVSISRRYNAAGRTLLDDMTLPMGGTRGVESLHYRMEAAGSDSDKTLLEIAMQPKAAGQSQGSFYSLSLEGGPVADDVDRGVGVEGEAGQQVGDHRRVADARVALEHDVGPLEAQLVGFLTQPLGAEPAVLDHLFVADPARHEQGEPDPVEPAELRQKAHQIHRHSHSTIRKIDWS